MQGISKQEYRQARRLLRDNGKAAIGWMTPKRGPLVFSAISDGTQS